MENCVRLGGEEPAGAAFVASGCSSVAEFLSSALLCNGAVRCIRLTDEFPPSSAGCEGSDLLISVKGVREREAKRSEAGSLARFWHDLATSIRTSSSTHELELVVLRVEFASIEEFAILCSGIGSPLCTLLHLTLVKFTIQTMSSANIYMARTLLKDALFHNTSLHSLTLYTSPDVCSPECLMPALTRSTPCSSITHLVLWLQSPHTLDDVSGIFTGLAHNTISLTRFEINNNLSNCFSHDMLQLIGSMLLTNTSLVSLELYGFHLPGELVQMLFASLEQNTHLTILSLRRCKGPDWPSASFVLDILRVNGILRSLNLKGTPLEGKNEAAIEAQLAKNRESPKRAFINRPSMAASNHSAQDLGHDVPPEVQQRKLELPTLIAEVDSELGKLPRMFVLTTNDTGLGRKLVAGMIPGLQNVRLELLCEHRGGPHLVAEQRGITLASVVDTPEISSLPTYLHLQTRGAPRISFEGSQQWLFKVLSKHNCCTSTRIHEVFGLSRVQYGNWRAGWLCDAHLFEGILWPV